MDKQDTEKLALIFKQIADMFKQYPCFEGLETIKLLSSSKTVLKTDLSTLTQLCKALVEVRKNCSLQDWQSPRSLGNEITKFLFEIWLKIRNDNNEGIEQIPEAIDDDLTNRSFWSSEKDYARVQNLLFFYRDYHGPGRRDTVIYDVTHALIIKLNHFTRVCTQIDPPLKAMPKEIATMTEVLVEMSHQNKELTESKLPLFSESQTNLKIAMEHLIQFPIPYVVPGIHGNISPSYQTILSHAFASVFVIKFIDKKHHETLLWQLLEEAAHFQSNAQYPLAKIVVGTLTLNDIPLKDRNNVMAQRLVDYKGVFTQDVDQKLKDAYLEALLNGGLGGRNLILLDVLENLYLNSNTLESWKSKIEDAFRELKKSETSERAFQQKIDELVSRFRKL